MTHEIQFKKMRPFEMENAKRKLECPHPVWVFFVIVIVFLFAYFCRDGLITFVGWKSIDVHKAESEKVEKSNHDKNQQQQHHHRHRHLPTKHNRPTSNAQKLHPPHNLSDSVVFMKIQRATFKENNKTIR